jgi:hypothetical protein
MGETKRQQVSEFRCGSPNLENDLFSQALLSKGEIKY